MIVLGLKIILRPSQGLKLHRKIHFISIRELFEAWKITDRANFTNYT